MSAASALQADQHPRLTGSHPCPATPGFRCASLTVPLDHAGRVPGSLKLNVGLQAAGVDDSRGVLLFLSGGPGQPGVSLIERITTRLGPQLKGYRLVMFDQRGTGAGALRCPALQASVGTSDLTVPRPGTIAGCASSIGPKRRYFTTPETLADIDELRSALGASRLTLDGVSYGTFVAERYALAYPTHVNRLVLDSVVPQVGADPMYLAAIQETASVLRSACSERSCSWDPARDLAMVVASRHDGPQLLDAIVAESIAFPSFPALLPALHAAAAGHLAALQRFIAAVDRAQAAPAGELSQGLHESTLCLDLPPPWDPASSTASRAALLARSARSLAPSRFFPFDRDTATGNGIARGCLEWPPTKPASDPPAVPAGNPADQLPRVPILLFEGERDLSTPMAWAREEAARAPGGRLIAVPGAGHSVQLHATDPSVRRILGQFLAGR